MGFSQKVKYNPKKNLIFYYLHFAINDQYTTWDQANNMAFVHARYQYWINEMQGCYDRADINAAWYIKYEVTGTLQQLMDINGPRTRQVLETIRNLLKLESEISISIYLTINREINNNPLDYSIQRR